MTFEILSNISLLHELALLQGIIISSKMEFFKTLKFFATKLDSATCLLKGAIRSWSSMRKLFWKTVNDNFKGPIGIQIFSTKPVITPIRVHNRYNHSHAHVTNLHQTDDTIGISKWAYPNYFEILLFLSRGRVATSLFWRIDGTRLSKVAYLCCWL